MADMQHGWLKHQIHAQLATISAAEEPILALNCAVYDAVEEKMLEIVEAAHCKGDDDDLIMIR